MTRAPLASGIELEYDTFGSPDHPTLLLVMGVTAQMTGRDDGLSRMLADRGRHVVRLDNRDYGRSTKLDGVAIDPGPILAALVSGRPIPPVIAHGDAATELAEASR
jgi:pimeloyl-ACP methyl ester carboxylesterase